MFWMVLTKEERLSAIDFFKVQPALRMKVKHGWMNVRMGLSFCQEARRDFSIFLRSSERSKFIERITSML